MYLVEMSWLLLLVLNSQVPQHQSYLSHQCSRNKDEECIFIPVLFIFINVLYVICRENKIVYVLHTMMYFQASEYKGRRIQGKKFP